MPKQQIILPTISEAEHTPLVDELLSIIRKLKEQTDHMQDEINRLKKHKGKPKIKASVLGKKKKSDKSGRGKTKRKKTNNLEIHETRTIDIEKKALSDGAKFKGYKHYTIQEIEIKTHNILFKLARWRLPNGKYITASLPEEYQERHFGPTLSSYVLHQYHHQGVTQPLLLDQLREFGIQLSSGQLSQLLTKNQDDFHREKGALLTAGLNESSYIQADDTGARHKGKNCICTHIGNEEFAFFKTTDSKSRSNFLKLLHCEQVRYCLDISVIELAQSKGFNYYLCTLIQNKLKQTKGVFWFDSEEDLKKFLIEYGFATPGRFRSLVEWTLMRSLKHYFGKKVLGLVTDEAGQFDFPLFAHGLCWFHVERKIVSLVPTTKAQVKQLTSIRNRFWNLYYSVKKYKTNPTKDARKKIERNFNRLVKTKLKYPELENVLQRIEKLKSGLLLALDRPEIPLHNNLSENDIREYVKKRKISGSTRSDDGKQCRDTFTSLKKTCKKQGIKFWHYLQDRIGKKNEIEWLPSTITQSLKRKYAKKLVATST